MATPTFPYPTANFGLAPDFTAQYSSNIELLLQQEKSVLRDRVTVYGGLVGKMASPVTQYSSITMKQPVGRFAPLNHTNPYSIRPWMMPQPGEIVELIDDYDRLQTIVDPTSAYMQAATAATNRYYDDGIITATTGSRQIGTDIGNLTADTFVTGSYQIASTFGSSSASGLIVPKLIEARRILQHYHNDLERDPPTVVIGSQQEADLLNQTTVVSTEFNEKPVLVDGRVRRFLGMDIAVSERLSVSSNVRTVLVFVKSGMALGLWKDIESFVDQRIDLSGRPWQLTQRTMFGPVRTQNGKVVSILCSDSSGTDITP